MVNIKFFLAFEDSSLFEFLFQALKLLIMAELQNLLALKCFILLGRYS